MPHQLFRLDEVQPNPFRNIDRYPINRDKVEKLKESIGRTDFWDNLVARVKDGKPEIGYGHHRMVALRELFPPDWKVSLIVRDLDDAAMLHVMADENMQEWAASGAVIVETVRAVRDFLIQGAPAAPGRNGKSPIGDKAIMAFLGWPEGRVKDALSIIYAEEEGELEPEDTADLGIEQATIMRREVSRQLKTATPAVRKQAITRVRQDLQSGAIGKRGISTVVAEVRANARGAVTKPAVPGEIAAAVQRDIERFWTMGVRVNGATLSREEVVRLIAANADAEELQHALPYAEWVARAIESWARTGDALVAALRPTADMAAVR